MCESACSGGVCAGGGGVCWCVLVRGRAREGEMCERGRERVSV